MRITRYLLPVILVLNLQAADAQNVTGHWFGIGMLQTSGNYQNYLSELVLRQKGRIVSGTLQYYFKDSLVKVPVNGSFDDGSRRLSIKPFNMIYFLSPSAKNSIDCAMSGSFLLTVSKAESTLSGSLSPDANHRYTVPNINFRLVRSNDTLDWVKVEEPAPIKQTDTVPVIIAATPVKEGPLPEIQAQEAFVKREKVFSKEIEVTGTTLKLEIYDNGQIDYDSVSLFFNNKLILPKRKLDHRAIRLTIELDPAIEDNELSMFAENLGMIPPNTAALIITDGQTRYETLLSSDLSKSATIKLKRKKQ